MRAKVNPDWPQGIIRAFSGREYVKYEWRAVPDGNEVEARRLDAAGLLDFQGWPKSVEIEPEPAQPVAPLKPAAKVTAPVKITKPAPAGKGSVNDGK